MAASICCPHPTQVGLPHLVQTIFLHIPTPRFRPTRYSSLSDGTTDLSQTE